jgi:hypothetical protein
VTQHRVIITTPPPGGGNLVATGDSEATVTIDFHPGHELTAEQERRRIERAKRMSENVRAMLVGEVEPHVE